VPVPQAGVAAATLDNPYQTPEAFAHAPIRVSNQDMALASRSSRLSAAFVDGLIGMGLYIPVVLAASMGVEPGSSSWGLTMLVTLLALVFLAILQIYYISRDGQSLGKKATKIRIVRYDDGGNPGFGKAVGLRLIVNGMIGIVPGYALVDLLFIFGAEQRCLHDYIAGTKVVEA
jgi:uncharacterized RDD family membrane protein YckC